MLPLIMVLANAIIKEEEVEVKPARRNLTLEYLGRPIKINLVVLLDIQVVLDYFAVITYITNYYAKDDTGTMENIRKVMKECQSKDLKDRMKQVANVFLTYRQMGEAEAVYRLVPSMTLSMSNIGCQFVALGPKEERSSRWRKATEADLTAGVPMEELANHQGLWYEQHDMWSKYLRRPDSLAEICFAQFSKMYKSFNPKASKEDGDEPKEDEYINKAEEDDFHEDIDDEFDDEFEKFNYCFFIKIIVFFFNASQNFFSYFYSQTSFSNKNNNYNK